MLEIQGLTLSHTGFSLSASFAVETTGRTAVLGPSGSGKSTLLAGIGGFHRPDAGQILIDGHDITDKSPSKRDLSFVFQDQNLFPHMTAAQNVGLALSPNLKLTDQEQSSVSTALERVGLAGLEGRRPAELSGGQQARVTLARVLLQSGKMVLLDEPFSALGPALRSEMLGLIAQLCDETGLGVLMVTHDPEDALVLCPTSIVVAGGEVFEPRPTKDRLDNPEPALAAYLGNQSFSRNSDKTRS